MMAPPSDTANVEIRGKRGAAADTYGRAVDGVMIADALAVG
jgi:hypothetical protein